jgi:hypothetical protein
VGTHTPPIKLDGNLGIDIARHHRIRIDYTNGRFDIMSSS